MKRCPYCKEQIQDEAIKCKHCGSMLGGIGTDTLDRPLTLGASESEVQYDTLDAAPTQGQAAMILANQYRIVRKIGEGRIISVSHARQIQNMLHWASQNAVPAS